MYDTFYLGDEEYQTTELDGEGHSYTIGSVLPDRNGTSNYTLLLENEKGAIGLVILSNIVIIASEPDRLLYTFNSLKKDKKLAFKMLASVVKTKINPQLNMLSNVFANMYQAIDECDKYETNAELVPNYEYRYIEEFRNGASLAKTLKAMISPNNKQE
jgi:hypothetical protein